MLEAVIFDFDGVLVDSEPLHFRSFRDTLVEAGIDLAEQDYFTRYLGLSDRAAFETIGADHARPWTRIGPRRGVENDCGLPPVQRGPRRRSRHGRREPCIADC